MKKLVLLLLCLCGMYPFAQAQNNHLKVAGNLQGDTLKANALKIKGNTANNLLLSNGKSVSLGNNLQVSNDSLKFTGSVGTTVTVDTQFVKNSFVALSNEQSISGTKTFENFASSSDFRFRDIKVGKGAGTGGSNIIVGDSASMLSNTSGNNNVGFGLKSLVANTTGAENTAIGYGSLNGNTSGSGNVAVGRNAMFYNTTGSSNTSLGQQSLFTNTTGGENTAIGSKALFFNSTNAQNTALGTEALYYNLGDLNVAIGYRSMYNKVSGNGNIAIGANQEVGSPSAGSTTYSASNKLNIGGAIFGTGITGTWASPAGKLGIGLNNPSVRLEVNGDMSTSDTLTVGKLVKLNGSSANILMADGTTLPFPSGFTLKTTNLYDFAGNKGSRAAYGVITNTPKALIEIEGTGYDPNAIFKVSSPDYAALTINSTASAANGWVGISIFRDNGEKWFMGIPPSGRYMYIKGGNNVAIGTLSAAPTEKLHVAGNIRSAGSISSTNQFLNSDRRLKTDIQTIGMGMETLKKLRPVQYQKKKELLSNAYEMSEYGFIAQEVEQTLPLLVQKTADKDELRSLNYNGLIPLLTKAMQEQQLSLEQQNTRLQQQAQVAKEKASLIQQIEKQLAELNQTMQKNKNR